MAQRGKTSSELNLFHIQKTLKKLNNGEISIKGCGLNKRFEKLKVQSLPWYEDLHPKYVNLAKILNKV
tara:strand:+ start:5001 stop:5204 length:204 start_codon:yes stop_codon:yes gene_type:complete